MKTKKLTQAQRILNLLKERGNDGAFVYEFMLPRPQGLGIAQYNARIFELRREGYNIINKIDNNGHNYFVLQEEDQQELFI